MNIETYKDLEEGLKNKKYGKFIFVGKSNGEYGEKFLLEVIKSEKGDVGKEGKWNYFFSFLNLSKQGGLEKAGGISTAHANTKKEILEKISSKLKIYGFKDNNGLVKTKKTIKETKLNPDFNLELKNDNSKIIEEVKENLEEFIDFVTQSPSFWLLSLSNNITFEGEKKKFLENLNLVIEGKQYGASYVFARGSKDRLLNTVSIQYAKEDGAMLKGLSFKIETLMFRGPDEKLEFSTFRDFKNSFENRFS